MVKLSTQNITALENIAFWLFMYLFIFDYHFIENNWTEAIGRTFLEVLTYAVIIYFNYILLIPFLWKKNRKILYFLSVGATVMCYVIVMRWSGWEQYFYEYSGWRNVFSMVLNTFLFLLMSFLYWYFKQWHIERERYFMMKNEKLETELSFLRTQISPHFIFNTLNNIYTLVLQKHDNAAPMIAKLSALLRHILYEGNQEQILLKKEMDTLKQYIELHLLRKPRSKNIDFYVEGALNGWKIAPMLLINFVENAFKHSDIDQSDSAWIKINCDINDNGKLIFSTENSTFSTPLHSEKGGIGLKNIRRQLDLNYPDLYTLSINNESGVFYLQLTIQLKKV